MKPDTDSIQKRIQESVAQRRQLGQYPVGFEQQINSEFQTITDASAISRRARRVQMRQEIVKTREALDELTRPIPTSSRFLFGSLFHKFANLRFRRQTSVTLQRTRSALSGINATIEFLFSEFEDQTRSDRAFAASMSQIVSDHLAVVEHLSVLIVDLERRINAVESELSPNANN